MKILQAHTTYIRPGGEDIVQALEFQLLHSRCQTVNSIRSNNEEYIRENFINRAINLLWNHKANRLLLKKLQEFHPNVLHVHNTFPSLSPSIYSAAIIEDVPIVQTLHNYRILCPNALLMRNNQICEECLAKFLPWPGIHHACYRNSRTATTATAAMLILHRILRTYNKQIDIFITLTEFSRHKFIQGGLPPEKIVVKPNFLPSDPGPRFGLGKYALFVGRLSPEKGLFKLLEAWCTIPGVPLNIIGDGPLWNELRDYIHQHKLNHVKLLGQCDTKKVHEMMKSARFLIFPSLWYETFGMVVIEAYACGLPVIASRLGSMEELVVDGKTGLHFTPGNSQDLATKVTELWEDELRCGEMGKRARHEYETKYTAEENYRQLMAIYQLAIHNHSTREKGNNRQH